MSKQKKPVNDGKLYDSNGKEIDLVIEVEGGMVTDVYNRKYGNMVEHTVIDHDDHDI